MWFTRKWIRIKKKYESFTGSRKMCVSARVCVRVCACGCVWVWAWRGQSLVLEQPFQGLYSDLSHFHSTNSKRCITVKNTLQVIVVKGCFTVQLQWPPPPIPTPASPHTHNHYELYFGWWVALRRDKQQNKVVVIKRVEKATDNSFNELANLWQWRITDLHSAWSCIYKLVTWYPDWSLW